MEKERIIKASMCWMGGRCIKGACPLYKEVDGDMKCTYELPVNALALIKELTEDNERLSTALANYDRQTEVRIAEEYYTAEAYDELREENERLTKKIEMSEAAYQELQFAFSICANQVKADTVREFAERLKYTLCINNEENTEFFDYSYTLETIDEVANEILNKNTEGGNT